MASLSSVLRNIFKARSKPRRSHQLLLDQIAELGQRLDRLEATVAATAAASAPGRDTLDRIELGQRQSHDVLLGQIGEIGQRLDRLEAAALERESKLNGLLQSVAAAVQSLNSIGRASAVPAEFGRGPLARADLRRMLNPDEAEMVFARLPDDETLSFHVRDDRTAATAVAAVRAAIESFAAARSTIAPDSAIVWLLPRSCPDEVSDAELSQVAGLLARGVQIAHGVGSAGTSIIVALRRPEFILPIVRWTARRLRDTHGPQHLRSATPAIALEPCADEQQAMEWASAVAESLKTAYQSSLGDLGATRCGIVWPLVALDIPEPYIRAAGALRSQLEGNGVKIVFQWVDGVPAVSQSTAVQRLAREIGVRLDLTATVRSQTAEAFAAYDDLVPYRPIAFDLRIPGFGTAPREKLDLVCVARQDVCLTPADVEDPFAEVAARRAARLAAVLDRSGAQMMRQTVADGREQAGSWEKRIVYNWKDIEPIWVRALVFEPYAVAMPAGSVGLVVTSPDGLLTRLAESDLLADLSRRDARALQVTAHAYLDQRHVASADSLRLASWLPEELGDTLEIGCGFGVLARTFIARTRSYTGLDLTEEQARAIIGLGGKGVVGDIHDLPFSDRSFDVVIGDNVVEHALDPERVLSEVRRVLRPGGRAFFVIPLDYLGADYRNEAHFWKADERSIRAALANAGLKVERHETCVLPEIGAKGSFPSCNQRTSLWEVRPVTDLPCNRARSGDRLVIDWRAMLCAQSPKIAATAAAVTRDILALNEASNLAPLARNSPALRDFNWSSYLELSQIRVVRAAACLERRGVRGRVLDIGSYFGNFAMVLARLGYDVTALDHYTAYAPAFDRHVAAMRASGIEVVDAAEVGTDFAGLPGEAYDCVLCMGVIEHVPHTPRLLLAAIDRVLRPGGLLVLDTPNLAYEYKRHQLMEGGSVFAPIQTQFETEIPFEGHHREYTPAEIQWIVERIGYRDMELEMYNYSIHGLPELSGRDLERWRAMEADPERRELIFVSARKPS